MSDEEFPQPYYDPARREAMRREMIESGFLPNLPLEALSETERFALAAALAMEAHAVPYGGVEAMLDSFETEFETAKGYSLDEFRQMLALCPVRKCDE